MNKAFFLNRAARIDSGLRSGSNRTLSGFKDDCAGLLHKSRLDTAFQSIEKNFLQIPYVAILFKKTSKILFPKFSKVSNEIKYTGKVLFYFVHGTMIDLSSRSEMFAFRKIAVVV